jgi:holo-[acyl-carrier protein] synthase
MGRGEVLGVGIDLVDVPRVAGMLERFGDRALRRILTKDEISYVMSMARPETHVAARVAAKEAVFKALQAFPGADAVSWQHLEVVRLAGGRPTIALHGLAAELARVHGPWTIHLSLSHADQTAGAVALLLSA